MGRPRSVIAQGSTPAPIRRSLRLSSKTRRDGIAKYMKQNTQNKENVENAILLESSSLRPRSVIAQGSTPAPMDLVVNDDETKRLKSRKSLGLSSITRRDGIAKCMKQNTQNKENIKNAILLESSSLRPRSVIAQSSTPAPMDHVVNDDEIKRLRSRISLEVSRITRLTKTMQQMTDNLAERFKSLESMINVAEYMVSNLQTATTTQMIMERVNDDCLAEIFMYVPAWERPKIALVCKKWKGALDYSWFNVTKLELTYWRYHEFPCCLKKYQTDDGKLNFLKSLLDKCGRYLKTLDLTAYGYCNIVPIINNYCPNLEKLRLRFILIDDTMLSNAFTRLSKLKSLTIIFQNMEGKSIPVTLINSLKNVAGTLTELNLLNFVNHLDESCDYPKEFDCVIRELKVMKQFEVAGIRDSKNSFKYFQNNEMSSYYNHNEYLENPPFLGHPFMNIRFLNLKKYSVKDYTLYTIANTIKQLKSLAIDCTRITDNGVVTLATMNYLQNIYTSGHTNITDSSIKLLKNKVKLFLPQSNKITDVSVTKLVENSPKIEKLLLHFTLSVTANFVKKAAEISNQRKQLLKITIHSLIPDVKQYESPYFKIYILENEEK